MEQMDLHFIRVALLLLLAINESQIWDYPPCLIARQFGMAARETPKVCFEHMFPY